MDTINEDIITNVFEFLHHDAFLFIAPVNKTWERVYKKSCRGLFTGLDCILESKCNMVYACASGYDIILHGRIEDVKNNVIDLIVENFYEVLEYLVFPITVKQGYYYEVNYFLCKILSYLDNIDSYYEMDCVLSMICSFENAKNVTLFSGSAYMIHKSSKKLSRGIISLYGYPCGGCYTCACCEHDTTRNYNSSGGLIDGVDRYLESHDLVYLEKRLYKSPR